MLEDRNNSSFCVCQEMAAKLIDSICNYMEQRLNLPSDFYSSPADIPPKDLPTSNSPKHQSCD